MNPSQAPSGEKAAALLDLRAFVTCRDWPVVASPIQISVSYAFSSQFVSRIVNATCCPSGEIAGEPTRLRLITSSIDGPAGACVEALTTESTTPTAMVMTRIRLAAFGLM